MSDLSNNPYRKIRLSLGLSLREFGDKCNVNYQTIVSLEEGCWNNLPKGIAYFLASRGYPLEAIHKEYKEFITQKRTNISFQDYTAEPTPVGLSPVQVLFETCEVMNYSAAAKLICVQLSHLYKLYKGLAKHMPSQVELALRECGLRNHVIEEINSQQEEFYLWTKRISN